MSPHCVFSKSGQSDQMTMPARRASKFSAKRRALLPEVFFQSLNSQAIPGFCEPWSECQPEESRNDADGGDDAPTTITPSSHQQAPRTGIKYPVQGKPPHSDIWVPGSRCFVSPPLLHGRATLFRAIYIYIYICGYICPYEP